MRRELLPLLFALALCALPGRAHAFCRATTCDETDPKMHCEHDAHDCPITGPNLWWSAPCVTVWLPDEPEPLPGVGAERFEAEAELGFAHWSAVDCGRGQPSIDVRLGGALALECALTGYDQDALENVNTVRVVNENWPHPKLLREIALTTLTFDVETGEILDADIELNADQRDFSIGDAPIFNDLQGALTHEAGHVLGLAHSDVRDATMFETAPEGSTTLRTLEADDIAGICSIYPPEDGEAQACAHEAAAGDPAAVCAAVVTPRPPRSAGGCAVAASESQHYDSALVVLAIFGLRWHRRRGRQAVIGMKC